MKNFLKTFICFFILVLPLSGICQSPQIQKEEAQKAFLFLNKIRANPNAYSKEFGVDLAKEKKLFSLIWNDTLAKVAEERAMDMATQKYFSHVNKNGKAVNILVFEAGYIIPKDWFKQKNMNTFESIQAGAIDGEDAIKDLIIDEYDTKLGHRKHLLGIGEWNSSLKDIGIGFVKSPNSPYKTYTCVIIAKHNW